MLTTVEKVLALKNVELFSDIPGEVLADIAFVIEEMTMDRGTYIVHEGELGRELFIIVKGEVDVVSGDRKIDTIRQGGYFGEMAILDSQPRSADVVSLSDVTLLKIDRDDFYEIMKQRDEVAIGIIKVLNRRIRNLTKQLVKNKNDDDV